jgi:ABC-2 type transport system permease protein
MIFSIFLLELKYQFRSPAFWTSLILFFVGAFLITSVTSGSFAHTHFFRNAPSSIVRIQILFSGLFYVTVSAMASDLILRDENTNFSSILYSTRLHQGDYIWTKLLAVSLAASICFIAVPAGLFLGASMPWIEPSQYCRHDFNPYKIGYCFFALPNIFVATTVLAALATLSRSSMAAYVGVVVLFSLQFLFSAAIVKYPGLSDLFCCLEPTGIDAFAQATEYWTTAELNTTLPAMTEFLFDNRLICIFTGLASGLLMSALTRLRGGNRRPGRKRIDDSPYVAPPAVPVVSGKAAGHPELTKFVARCKLEILQIILRPAYLVMLLIAFALSFITDDSARQIYGASIYPVTRLMISEIDKPVTCFALIAAVFYGGEIVWKERELQIQEIVDATSISNWAYLSSKLIALMVALTIILFMCPLAGVILQISRGYFQFEPIKYFLWFVWPNIIQFFYYAILTIFFQSLAPNKHVGWGLTVLSFSFLICQGLLFDYHLLYYFASTPPVPLSDMNGEDNFWIGRLWLQLYWGAFCILLLTIAHTMIGRGVSLNYMARLSNLPSKFNVRSRIVFATAACVFVALGVFVYYNTNVLNNFWSTARTEEWTADYERLFIKIGLEPEPSIADIKLQLDLYPEEHRYISSGKYTLKNRTAKPLEFMWLDSPRDMKYKSLSVQGAKVVAEYPEFDMAKYRFNPPLLPDAETTMTFVAEVKHRGFTMSPHKDIVGNGTLLLSDQFTPMIGVRQRSFLTDKAKRKKYNLPAQRNRQLGTPGADAQNYIGGSWATADITVSTSGDQTPFCPGIKVADSTENGRRRARFVSKLPLLSYFSVQSGRYESKHRLYKGIDLGVYYHAQHPYDVDRMLDALAASLDYLQANFGPYQFKAINILEAPDYALCAMSLAGTIPFSEGLGFVSKIQPGNVDYVTYVTAHEFAHQWWAHQVVGASEPGATLMSETLAQHSALMIMENMYGPLSAKNFVHYELKYYLKSRNKEQDEERPLIKVDNQPYLHYNKGAMVFYLIEDHLGEAAMNRALRAFLNEYRYKGPPYPTSLDLEKYLLGEARTEEDKTLIRDLLENIMLVKFNTGSATTKSQPDGTYKTDFYVDARKYYADGQGNHKEAPLDAYVDVGCFASDPTLESLSESDVILVERRHLRSGWQPVSLITKARPRFVAVDPYFKWITRDESGRAMEVSQ